MLATTDGLSNLIASAHRPTGARLGHEDDPARPDIVRRDQDRGRGEHNAHELARELWAEASSSVDGDHLGPIARTVNG